MYISSQYIEQPRLHPRAVEPQSTLITLASLDADFASLLLSVCDILSNSPNQENNLEQCKKYCLLLKISNTSNERLFSPEKIKKCVNFMQLFEIIKLHMSWDQHSILTHIANECNSNEAQQEIEKFEKKLGLFQGLEIIFSTSKQTLSKDFAKFCVIINKPYKNLTTDQYTNIKAYIFSNLETNAYVTVGFIRVLYHSLQIEWLVTVQAVPHMVKSANQNKHVFIQGKFVFMQIGSEVVIGDKVCMYVCMLYMYVRTYAVYCELMYICVQVMYTQHLSPCSAAADSVLCKGIVHYKHQVYLIKRL